MRMSGLIKDVTEATWKGRGSKRGVCLIFDIKDRMKVRNIMRKCWLVKRCVLSNLLKTARDYLR